MEPYLAQAHSLHTPTTRCHEQSVNSGGGHVREGEPRECWLDEGEYRSLVIMSILSAGHRRCDAATQPQAEQGLAARGLTESRWRGVQNLYLGDAAFRISRSRGCPQSLADVALFTTRRR